MTDSSSDSDCFESADEGFDDENISKYDNIKSSQQENSSSHIESFTPTVNNLEPDNSETRQESSSSKNNLQYRKRPEKRKNVPNTLAPIIIKEASLNNQIFKSDIMKPDVLIQDITTNLSKNFNKGFNTIQQTSSSIKGLVMSSLPVTLTKEDSSKFSYDDEEDIVSDLPEYGEDSVVNKTVENNLKQPNIVQEFIKSKEERLTPSSLLNQKVQVKPLVEQFKELDFKISSVKRPESRALNEEYMCQKTIDEINDKVEESGDFTCIDEAKDYCEEVKKEKDQQASDSKAELHSNENSHKENHKTKGDKIDSYIKDEVENMNEEKHDDRSKSKSADVEINEDRDNNNDGWDTSELEFDGLEIEECSETNPDQYEHEEKDVNPAASGDVDTALDNAASACNEGWDDFDFDDEDLDNIKPESKPKPTENFKVNQIKKTDIHNSYQQCGGANEKENDWDNKWAGWDHFGESQETKQKSGWTLSNWGVNALLNTATSVTQGLSTVLEAGLGAPDPETLAKMEIKSMRDKNENCMGNKSENLPSSKPEEHSNAALKLFPDFGISNLVAGVTKNIVEHSKVQEIGSKVIAGGLDTLESFGKKTMEVLQEGDPGLKRKRALLLGSNKPILSQVLREAKAKAEIEDKRMEEKQMAKMCHFETLFDDFQGLIHLEALEMLSRQCELKLEQMKAALPMKEAEDMVDIMDEVKELCVIDEDEFKSNYSGMVDFKLSLTKVTEPLKNEISIQKINQTYEELNTWFQSEENYTNSSESLFQKAMSVLAELTAATVQQFHKAGELLSIKEHRKTVEEADALLQMTGIVCCEINKLSERFLKLHQSQKFENDLLNKKIIKESANATSYIKAAFNLLIPVLQLGAAT